MLEYFKLQMVMNNRRLQDAGVSPVIGYLLIAFFFIAGSFFLFYKTAYAAYIYPVLALSFNSRLSELKRNEFLKMCYGDKLYSRIRILENCAVTTPFVAVLLFKLQFAAAAVLLVLSAVLALGSFKTQMQFTLPTPFGKRPYEFAAGFRNTYLLIAICYVLVVVSVVVSNFNLGVFALLFVYIVALSFYQYPEPEYVLWSHSFKPAGFLVSKFKVAVLHVTILALPLAIVLSVVFFSEVQVLLGVMLLGYVYLCCVIAARYSAHPHEISIPQGILLSLCIFIPPTIIIILPYFIKSSINKLQPVLK